MDWQTYRRDQRGKALRKERMAKARLLGRHTPEQWNALQAEFGGHCVRCWTTDYGLERDHIIPIYQGGSDGIENIQPVCPPCNRQKGPETTNWKEIRRNEILNEQIKL